MERGGREAALRGGACHGPAKEASNAKLALMILASAHPVGLLLSAAAALAYTAGAGLHKAGGPALRAVLFVAWLLHGASILWALFAGTPRFGFAPALSVTAWLVLAVYAIERQFFPALQARLALAGLGGFSVLLALLYPGAPLHVSVSPWLPLHLVLGVASYGLFAAAVVHAGLMTRAEKRMRRAADSTAGLPLLTLERLTFRFVAAGFVLLSATLLAGLVFGEQLYGHGGAHGWKWDHKTVFSLLAWVTFAGLLLGRSRYGWRGPAAVRVLYVGAGLLLLAYVGSRFVLEVVLGRSL